jgi:xanthine/CO dehydrogenase XdhC/CoxF family maturation factor
LFTRGESGTVATVFRGPPAGQRLFSENDGGLGRSLTQVDQEGNEFFSEVIRPPIKLFIFGAGYDAIPLARNAKQLGYEVTVCDRRPAYATRERFPDADHVFVRAAADIPNISSPARSAAVIMSHHYVSDREYLEALLPLPLPYLGLMGPRLRAETMLQEIRAEGVSMLPSRLPLPRKERAGVRGTTGDELLHKLHNPIGLDIGAEGPHEIALAILAEINAVFAGHGGGLLREKKGPIHSPRTELR